MHIYICHNYLIGMFEAGGIRGRGTKPTAVLGLKNFSFSCHTALPFLWLFYLHGEQQPALKLAVCRATINSSSITTNRSNIPSNNNNKIKFNESQMRNKQKGRASCCVVLCGIWLPFFMAIFNVIFSVEWGIQGALLL